MALANTANLDRLQMLNREIAYKVHVQTGKDVRMMDNAEVTIATKDKH